MNLKSENTREELLYFIAESYSDIASNNPHLHYFPGIDLSGEDFTGKTYPELQLISCQLSRIIFSKAKLFRSSFELSNSTGAVFRYARLEQANFRNARCPDSDFFRAYLHDAIFYHTDLSHSKLRYADLRNADLCGADLSFADLTGADLRGGKFNRLKSFEHNHQ